MVSTSRRLGSLVLRRDFNRGTGLNFFPLEYRFPFTVGPRAVQGLIQVLAPFLRASPPLDVYISFLLLEATLLFVGLPNGLPHPGYV